MLKINKFDYTNKIYYTCKIVAKQTEYIRLQHETTCKLNTWYG